MAEGSNTGLLQQAVQGIFGIWNTLQNSYLFGSDAVTVGVSTVAGLPANPAQGTVRTVTDANSTTFHAIVAGGGTNILQVLWDGTNWRIT